MEKTRNPFFDNAKFILIFLVVFGHFIEPMIKDSYLAKYLYLLIYYFHMPAFIFISGYFASTNKNKGWVLKLVKKLLIPYILSQLIFIWFTIYILGSDQYKINLIKPAYIYWYLFALFVWSIIIKYIPEKYIKKIIFISFILGILAGWNDSINTKYSLSRIIVFLPFYLLGYYFRDKDIQSIFNKKISIVVLLVIAAITFIIGKDINHEFLLCYKSYSRMGYGLIQGSLYRVLLYVIQILISFSFFSIISNDKNRLTDIGTKTFSIYILHGFIVKILINSTTFYSKNNYIVLLLSFIITVAVIFIIYKIFNKKEINILMLKTRA